MTSSVLGSYRNEQLQGAVHNFNVLILQHTAQLRDQIRTFQMLPSSAWEFSVLTAWTSCPSTTNCKMKVPMTGNCCPAIAQHSEFQFHCFVNTVDFNAVVMRKHAVQV